MENHNQWVRLLSGWIIWRKVHGIMPVHALMKQTVGEVGLSVPRELSNYGGQKDKYTSIHISKI